MAETVVTEVVVPVAKGTLNGVWRQLGYMFWYRSNIGHLNDQVQQLRHKRDGIKLEEKTARDASKIIDGQVNDWLVKADKLIEDKSFSEETVAAKAACCSGWLPNLKSRHSMGRKAKKMTLEVDVLLDTAPTTIAHPAPHPEVEFPPTEDSTQLGTNLHEGESSSSGTSHHENTHALLNFDSRRSTVEEVMEALRRDQINPIIICGMGGIGKTTLMGQVAGIAKQKGLFDEYTKATFKESLNKAADFRVIQDELAQYLGLPLEEKETSDARANKLRQRLSQGSKKILVMLDNVWTTTPEFLWEIGIPHSCKLLVTSRKKDLFKNMDTSKNFPIHGLSDGDAWSLFKKTAGSCIESDLEFRDVAEKILKKCGGLPIAISTVGRALKHGSITIWRNALRELEKANPKNVGEVIEQVYGPIKFSYQSLPSEEAKSCLLLCCILGEKGRVPVEDLVREGLVLKLFEGIDSMVERRNCVDALVDTLKSRFLLLESDEKHKDSVRMHDVLRDVGLYIASASGIAVRDKAATVKLMGWPKDSDSEEILDCSSLGVSGLCQRLLLIGPLKPPPTIFNMMEDLKVLAIIGDRSGRRLSLESLVPSLAVLRNLHTLRLEYCHFNCDISVIGKLRTLMILSLRGSNIEQLPETFKDLSDLILLDLTNCWALRVIAPGVISSLLRLEELYMSNSFKDWVVEKLASTETTNWISQLEQESDSETKVETWKRWNRLAVEQPTMVGQEFRRTYCYGGVNAEQWKSWAYSVDWKTGLLRELLSLSHLTTLEVTLQPVNILLTTALFSKLERFKISIGWERSIYTGELKKWSGNYLTVYDLDGSVAMGSSITKLLEKASHVELTLTQPQLVNVLDRVCFAKTRCLKFQECNDVKHLFNTTTNPHSSSAIFPVLHTLEIISAERLKEIFHCELPTGSLKKLRSLRLFLLPELTYIWKKTNNQSESEWGVLRNMIGHVQVLYVSDCSSLKGIIVKDRAVYDDDEEVINFQCLTELTLGNLASFTGIISKGPEILPEDISPEQSDVPMQPLFDAKVHFPVLTNLDVSGINCKEIWNNQLSKDSFCELKSLRVRGFDKLLHLVPTHMQNTLQKLECIKAGRSPLLEEIFESGDQGTQMNKTVSFNFQNLREMKIWDCDSLRTLLSPSVARGLVKLQELQITDCKKIKEIVAAAAEGEETEDTNMFPQLRELFLSNLPNLGSFSKGKYNLKWPVAESIAIYNCGKMKKFCSGSLITSKKLKKIGIANAGRSLLRELEGSRQEIDIDDSGESLLQAT